MSERGRFADGVGAVVGGVSETASKTVVDMPVAFPDLRRAMADKGVAGRAQRQEVIHVRFPASNPVSEMMHLQKT